MAKVTMKSVRFHRYGGPQVLVYEEASRPEPGKGEVLIRVIAAAINPIDWKVRAGHLKERLIHKLPLIPGWDVSGIIASVGSGVEMVSVGEEVFGRLDTMRDGAYAEYAVSDASFLARKPASIDHITAASVPLAGLTAWQSLFEAAGLSAGQRVLIHGAGGSVGGFAVQFAKLKGATVIGAAKGADKEYALTLGADEVVDYDARHFEEAVSPVDIVLDVIGGEIQERSLKVLRKGGVLVSTLGIHVADRAREQGIETKGFWVRSDGEQLSEIARIIDDRMLKFHVETVLPLNKATEAHELIESGRARGKVVLKVSAS